MADKSFHTTTPFGSTFVTPASSIENFNISLDKLPCCGKENEYNWFEQ